MVVFTPSVIEPECQKAIRYTGCPGKWNQSVTYNTLINSTQRFDPCDISDSVEDNIVKSNYTTIAMIFIIMKIIDN